MTNLENGAWGTVPLKEKSLTSMQRIFIKIGQSLFQYQIIEASLHTLGRAKRWHTFRRVEIEWIEITLKDQKIARKWVCQLHCIERQFAIHNNFWKLCQGDSLTRGKKFAVGIYQICSMPSQCQIIVASLYTLGRAGRWQRAAICRECFIFSVWANQKVGPDQKGKRCDRPKDGQEVGFQNTSSREIICMRNAYACLSLSIISVLPCDMSCSLPLVVGRVRPQFQRKVSLRRETVIIWWFRLLSFPSYLFPVLCGYNNVLPLAINYDTFAFFGRVDNHAITTIYYVP